MNNNKNNNINLDSTTDSSSSSSSSSNSSSKSINIKKRKNPAYGMSIDEYFNKRTNDFKEVIINNSDTRPTKLSKKQIENNFNDYFSKISKRNENINNTISKKYEKDDKKKYERNKIKIKETDKDLKRLNFDMRINTVDNNFMDKKNNPHMLIGTIRSIKLELPKDYIPLGGRDCLTRYCKTNHKNLKSIHLKIQSIIVKYIGKVCNLAINKLNTIEAIERLKDNDSKHLITFQNKKFLIKALSWHVSSLPTFKFYLIVGRDPNSNPKKKKSNIELYLMDYFYYQLNTN